MSPIEMEAVAPASVQAVWAAILNAPSWAEWAPDATAAMSLQSVSLLAGPADHVGALRRGVSSVQRPLLGTCAVHWVDQVTDVTPCSTIELESITGLSPASWRVRFWLVPQLDGQTRVRCRILFRPATIRQQLALSLFLRRAIRTHARTMLDGLVSYTSQTPIAALPEVVSVAAEDVLTPIPQVDPAARAHAVAPQREAVAA